ncbi:MAG: hemolysin family protein [Deltaproteobacteria bacterium]
MSNGDWYKRLKLLIKAFYVRSKGGESIFASEEEVHTFIDAGTESGIINKEEGEMIHGIFDLKGTLVREVMVPRTEIVAIESDATLEDLIKLIKKEEHSRYPVFKESVDNIIGVIHIKDILTQWQGKGDIKIDRFIRPPFIVPETKNVEELLREFKRKRKHIAVVVDEYGGTSGVITIEDIIEEIIGEIQDEYDMEEVKIAPLADGSIIVDARLDIEELDSYFDIEIPKEKFETIGGLISFLAGRVPGSGEEVSYENLRFIIESADEKRVHRVRVIKQEPKEEEGFE